MPKAILRNRTNLSGDFLKDIWGFLKERKKFWLLPAILVLVFVGVILVVGGSTAVAPFIYTIF